MHEREAQDYRDAIDALEEANRQARAAQQALWSAQAAQRLAVERKETAADCLLRSALKAKEESDAKTRN